MNKRIIAMISAFFAVFLLTAFPAGAAQQRKPDNAKIREFEDYGQVIRKTVNMVSDSKAVQIAGSYGLNILNVTWEDTGRYKGSSVGPNISDMTIQVQLMDPRTEQAQLFCMPVIRFPNFSDKSCDVKPENFYLLVGNEKNKPLKKVNLKEFLGNMRDYMSFPDSWKGNRKSLLAQRDSHVLVSAQACFLPIPKKGQAEFNPVLFNYQSYKGNPAVLTILATREGTSVTIIDNQRDAFSSGGTWGQRLFFNKNGERASLTGKRLSDFLDEKKKTDKTDGRKTDKKDEPTEGLNMVLLIQVPLKHREMLRRSQELLLESMDGASAPTGAGSRSDVENAVIGHGKVEGPFTEVDNLAIERDARFPIRVTIQFYKATSNGVISDKDMASIAAQINKVYADADYVGSLVTEGETGRPTEYDGNKVQPKDWWDSFWNQYEREHGMSRDEAIKMLQTLFGPNWMPKNDMELRKEIEKHNK